MDENWHTGLSIIDEVPISWCWSIFDSVKENAELPNRMYVCILDYQQDPKMNDLQRRELEKQVLKAIIDINS